MSRVSLGRALAIAGVVTGILAIGLPYASGSRYLEDGTATAFLLVLLSFASWLPAEVGKGLLTGAAGAAAFGFYLVIPASVAFDSLGYLESGAWLGLCTALIPLGALVMPRAEREVGAVESRWEATGIGMLLGTAGLALIAVGIWLHVGSTGPTYWNVSSSGHALGLLLIVLLVVDVALLAGPVGLTARARDLAVLVAATTFGVVEFAVVSAAFEDFGSLGAGAWIEACGGALLIAGMLRPRHARSSEAAAPSAA